MSSYTSCPLAYRFSYVERLPQAPSAAASKGTLVHRALQHLHDEPPERRTVARALEHLDRARAELATDPDFAELELTEDEWDTFHADAAALVQRYFEIEDPTKVNSIGRELWLEAEIEGIKIRGVIDRLDVDADGGLVITDYKTGAAPKAGWEQKSLAGVNVYALLCEAVQGRRPVRLQLLYLSSAQSIATTPTEGSMRAVRSKATAIMQAVTKACETGDFRPRRSGLCAYCSFQPCCPEFGGDPDRAGPTLRAAAAGAPQSSAVPAAG